MRLFPLPKTRAAMDECIDIIQSATRRKDAQALALVLEELSSESADWDADRDSLSETNRIQGNYHHLVWRAKEALLNLGSAEELIPASDENIVRMDFRAISEQLMGHIGRDPNVLYQISPRKFEELIADLLTSMGWAVELTAATRDGGYDIFGIVGNVSNANIKTSYLVECKRFVSTRKVGISIARELLYVKSDLGVANALIATTSDFSSEVYALQNKRYDLDLKNKNAIVEWCRVYKPR